jgi:hypothetical protein
MDGLFFSSKPKFVLTSSPKQRRRENFLRMEGHIMELAREANLIADVGDGQLPREAEVEEL